MAERTQAQPDRTAAAIRRSWWPGWIWAIPLAALLVVGWVVLRAVFNGGEEITIRFDDAHGLKAKNANVIYRGLKVGQVTDVALTKDGNGVTVTAEIDKSATHFLRAGTEFWLRGTEPDLSNLSSLTAILSGPDIVMKPGQGKKTKDFAGLARKPLVATGAGKPETYIVALDGAVGALKPGQPVKLRGFTVGEVKSIAFRYDAKTGTIATPVTLSLYPALFRIVNAGAAPQSDALKAAIAELVGKGLRARLDRDPPLIGSFEIALDMSGNGAHASLAAMDGLPQIPAASNGGLQSLATRLGKLPVEQIAQNALDATHHLDALIAAPELKDAIVQLDASLKQVDATASKAGPQITSLVARLRQTAGQLDNVAQAANKVLNSTSNQNGLPQAVREITAAARSVRDLSDYLDRHPEALVQGRSDE